VSVGVVVDEEEIPLCPLFKVDQFGVERPQLDLNVVGVPEGDERFLVLGSARGAARTPGSAYP
jgi:hypothetical protein